MPAIFQPKILAAARYHLGRRTPNDDHCWIDVDGIRYSWRDGEAVLFDETYATAFNHFFINHIMRATSSHNEEGERPGAVNRAFGPAFKIKKTLKALKKKNRRLYLSVKYCVIIIILALIFLY